MNYPSMLMGQPSTETPEQIRLRELAQEYHDSCEAFDRIVCTGPPCDGAAMPRDGLERQISQRHARQVYDRLKPEAERLGFTTAQWWKAVQLTE